MRLAGSGSAVPRAGPQGPHTPSGRGRRSRDVSRGDDALAREELARRAGSASRREAARSGVCWDPGLPRPDAPTGYPTPARSVPANAEPLRELVEAPERRGTAEVVRGVHEVGGPGGRLLALGPVGPAGGHHPAERRRTLQGHGEVALEDAGEDGVGQ